MNNQSDNAAAPSRTTVRVPTASGDELEAWLYLPEGDGPHPAVVMAHGIGAIKAGGLAPFAERFCHEGFAAVVFDYRQWGGSSGQPREELSFPRQLEDYGTIIGWATQNTLPESTRGAMIDLLNQLADVLDLGLQTKQAHWNVKGPHFGTTTRKAINTAAEAGDADTADLFTEVSRGVDKLLWLVEAHLQAKE